MSAYVYCVARGSHPLPLEGLTGVGPDGPALRRVSEGDLVAVVSDAPIHLRAKRRDLTAHETILERLRETGTVLPMKFGMIAPDDGAIRAALRSGARRYDVLLARIDGHVELNVKASHHERTLLRELLLEDDELLERNRALQVAGGGSHQDRLAFGERVAAAVEERRARDAQRIIVQLAQHASDVRRGPVVNGCFVNVSFLVASGKAPAFATELGRVQQDLSEYASLEAFGPLPPYSFVGAEADA